MLVNSANILYFYCILQAGPEHETANEMFVMELLFNTKHGAHFATPYLEHPGIISESRKMLSAILLSLMYLALQFVVLGNV